MLENHIKSTLFLHPFCPVYTSVFIQSKYRLPCRISKLCQIHADTRVRTHIWRISGKKRDEEPDEREKRQTYLVDDKKTLRERKTWEIRSYVCVARTMRFSEAKKIKRDRVRGSLYVAAHRAL